MKFKQSITGIFIVIFLVGILAACGNNNERNEETGAEDVNTEEIEVTSEETRIYTDTEGNDVEIPVNPERVVTTQYLSQMLTLGIKPIGVGSHVLDNNYLGDLQEGVEDIGNPFSIEKVIDLEPDLIITANPDEVDQLSKVAPTVVVPWMYGDVFTQLNEIASILGKEKEAEEWIASHEEAAAEGRDKIQDNIGEDEIVTIFMAWGKDVLRIYGARNIGHSIYRSLELTPPNFIQEILDEDPEFSEFVNEEISMEMLPEYAGDHIIMLVYGEEAAEEGGMFHQIEESSLWKNLDAVKNDQVYFVNVDPWFNYDPLAVEQSLNEAIELFSGE
ncbi:ABC transporter substrate-binding protein [Salipaludibacillus sp. HK11]|uniref:ABC transporter substrate-binding protein n=1 Tax=Salipaludibacillus sp. HK11 TaxID=3394320 RepID=UPI0039FDAA60